MKSYLDTESVKESSNEENKINLVNSKHFAYFNNYTFILLFFPVQSRLISLVDGLLGCEKNEDEVSRKLFDSSYFDHPLIFEPWNQDFMVRFGLHCPA